MSILYIHLLNSNSQLKKHEEKLSELTKSYTDFEQDLHDIKYLLDDVHFKIDQIK